MPLQTSNPGIKAASNIIFTAAFVLLVAAIKVLRIDEQICISDLGLSLKYLSPSLFVFLLSAGIIFIAWSQHLAILRLVDNSSPRFKYANAFLLLTIVLLPFSAAFVAEYGLTELAGPAVAIYSFVNLLQAIARTLLIRSALSPVTLTKSNDAKETMQSTGEKSFYFIFVYAACTALAFWLPLVVAVVIALTWITWLFLGLRVKERN